MSCFFFSCFFAFCFFRFSSHCGVASTTVTYSTGWYQVVIDWLTSNAINVTVYDSTGAVFATLSTTIPPPSEEDDPSQ